MNAVIQLDLFEDFPTETQLLRADLEATDLSLNKVRRALFARVGAIERKMIDLEQRLEIMERNICRGLHPQATKEFIIL